MGISKPTEMPLIMTKRIIMTKTPFLIISYRITVFPCIRRSDFEKERIYTIHINTRKYYVNK